jgi:hypothetical protein
MDRRGRRALMPPTPKAAEEAITLDAETPAELGFSRQSHFATYKPDDDPELDEAKNPPDGPHVVQELGKPKEGPAKAFGAS